MKYRILDKSGLKTKWDIIANLRFPELPKHNRKTALVNECVDLLEISEPTARKWFKGDSFPDNYNLMQICNAFNIDMDFWFTDQEEPNKGIATASESLEIDKKALSRIAGYDKHIKGFIDFLTAFKFDYLQHLLVLFYEYLSSEYVKPILGYENEGKVIFRRENLGFNFSVDGNKLYKGAIKDELDKTLHELEKVYEKLPRYDAKKTENTDPNNEPWNFAE